ncbi:MAG: MCE family protein [Verrucomicrobia bacterium]|nr:MCE family protein [Verrucomicrobiota bacterium]
MKNTLETRLGIFFALALVAAILIVEMAGGIDWFKQGTYVRARFNSVLELKKGDPVKMAGVPIGRVDSIDFADGKVEVGMKLEKKALVKTDSKATIKFTGLLGQNFVAIAFGSPAGVPVENNALLESQEQPDLSSLMTKLDSVASGVEGLAKNLGGENLNNLLGPFVDFMKQNNPKLTAILLNMQTISSQIAEGKGTVGKLINDEALYTSALSAVTNLNRTAEDVQSLIGDAKAAVADAKNVMAEVNAGKGTLGKLTKDEALYKETTTAMTNLREILQKINQGQGSVGKLVNDDSLFKNAKMTLQKVEKATEGLEDTGPLSVLGTVAGKLF